MQSLKKTIKSKLKSVFEKTIFKINKKKIAIISTLVLLVLASWGTALFFGIRMNLFVEKVRYQSYNHIGPNFSFHYPDHFVLDEDSEKKYGDDYIAGIRLATDQRTGCDIRLAGSGINFQKSDEEIKNALQRDLEKNAKNFKLLDFGRKKIDTENSFRTDFSFVDPAGNDMKLSQNIVSHDGQAFLVVCGTGNYQFKYFQKDFDGFFESIAWKK